MDNVGARRRRQRNRRTAKVRERLQRAGVRSDEERSSLWLVLQADFALEALIVTASESVDADSSRLQKDEKQLTEALKDGERVERVWSLAAHAVAGRAAAAASREGHWALQRLQTHHPLPDDLEEGLRLALDSTALGLGDVDTNLARLVLAELIDEDMMVDLTIFDTDGFGGVLTNELLGSAWDQTEEAFLRQAQSLKDQE